MAYKGVVLVLLLWIQSLFINALATKGSTKQKKEPVWSQLDLTSKTSTEDLEKHNARVLTMAQNLLNPWNKDDYLVSPIGLYGMLGTLSLMVKTGTSLSRDLDTTLQLGGQSLTSSSMALWNERWKKHKGLVFDTAMIWPRSLPSIQGTHLETILKESHTTLVDSSTTLKTFTKKFGYGQNFINPFLEKQLKTLGFINMVTFHLIWPVPPKIVAPQKYTYQYENNEIVKHIAYMKHSLNTKYHENENFKACLLPLAKSQGSPVGPLVVYVVSLKSTQENPFTFQAMWPTIYEELNKKKVEYVEIYHPAASFMGRRHFNEKKFPTLLKKKNADLSPLLSSDRKVTVTLTQIHKFCMDKDSVPKQQDDDTPELAICFPNILRFEEPFYIVLVNPKTGVIAFKTKVNEGLDANTYSCTEAKENV
ncbi:hypothetical protein HMI54_015225 [Coelomomyces lativittatus]|nr:hypothetical protein HMI54_015225 [Coelomomyces lativittatus]KAJ1514166.1 hypothetical protein HMI56_001048 [Coelomomyces lativittatus]KAJ1516839.1 hypothetical protein HMI55_001268 [Coelomomyces lativittatus]